jgi:hypothetical protein
VTMNANGMFRRFPSQERKREENPFRAYPWQNEFSSFYRTISTRRELYSGLPAVDGFRSAVLTAEQYEQASENGEDSHD